MELILARHAIEVPLNDEVSIDYGAFISEDPRVVDVQITTLPFDAEKLQLIVITTLRSEAEQSAYERALTNLRLESLEDLED